MATYRQNHYVKLSRAEAPTPSVRQPPPAAGGSFSSQMMHRSNIDAANAEQQYRPQAMHFPSSLAQPEMPKGPRPLQSGGHLVYHQDVGNDRESISQPQEGPEQQSDAKLVPLEINLLLKENRQAHRTSDYESQYLVLRRGRSFFINVRFDKPFDILTHKLALQFTIGSKSLISKGTHIRIPVNGDNSLVSGWRADLIKVDSESKNSVKIEVITSPHSLIGRYRMYMETQYDGEKPCLFRYADDIPMIFNPFCPDDPCYLAHEEEIKEYVFNEKGVIFLGTRDNIIPRTWFLGQFEFPCLEIAMWLLERANLPQESRGNPCYIARALAAMVNGGDRGMLESFKHTSTQQGFQPYEWIGSVKIVKKFMEQQGQPVRYGCCWTYSAVLCTLCRALGMPCRIVTAYNTAHDCDMCSSYDIHWNKNHRPITQLNKDIVMVSHTWNEMWFRRSELPEGQNGWEAVDSSSISASESLYRIGPCPVKAIREGRYSTMCDGPTFYAMLNGYIVHWLVGRNGDMSPLEVEDNVIATKIVTKSVGTDTVKDITDTYKDSSVTKLADQDQEDRRCRIIDYCKALHKADDVRVELSFMQEVTHGDTVMFTWILKNTGKEKRTCEFFMKAYFSTYDGKLIGDCKEARAGVVDLGENEDKQYIMKIRAEDYIDRIKPYQLLKIFSQMHVAETGQVKTTVRDFYFDAYEMIKLILEKSTVPVDRPFLLKIQITNPLKRILQNCTIHIEGIGIPRTVILERPIRPLEATVYQTQLNPTKIGQREIFVGFSCSVLNNIVKSVKVEVEPNTERERTPSGETVELSHLTVHTSTGGNINAASMVAE